MVLEAKENANSSIPRRSAKAPPSRATSRYRRTPSIGHRATWMLLYRRATSRPRPCSAAASKACRMASSPPASPSQARAAPRNPRARAGSGRPSSVAREMARSAKAMASRYSFATKHCPARSVIAWASSGVGPSGSRAATASASSCWSLGAPSRTEQVPPAPDGHAQRPHISLDPKPLDGLVVRHGGLGEPTPLAQGLGRPGEDHGAFGVAVGREPKGLRISTLGGLDVDPHGPVPGQDEVAHGLGLELLGVHAPSGPSKIQGGRVVSGQDLGVIHDPFARRPLDPRSGQGMPVRTRGPWDLAVTDIPDEGMGEGVFGLPLHRGASGRDG